MQYFPYNDISVYTGGLYLGGLLPSGAYTLGDSYNGELILGVSDLEGLYLGLYLLVFSVNPLRIMKFSFRILWTNKIEGKSLKNRNPNEFWSYVSCTGARHLDTFRG